MVDPYVFYLMAKASGNLVRLALLNREYWQNWHSNIIRQYSRILYLPFDQNSYSKCSYLSIHSEPEKNLFYHRENGPSLVNKNRTEYRQFNKLHREDGPALVDINPHNIKYPQSSRIARCAKTCKLTIYCIRGKYHRADGPAVIRDDKFQWWFEGLQYNVLPTIKKKWCPGMQIHFHQESRIVNF